MACAEFRAGRADVVKVAACNFDGSGAVSEPLRNRPADPNRGPSVEIVVVPRGNASQLRISFDEYKNRKYLSLRVWNKLETGWYPDGRKGVTVRLGEIKDVIGALNKAAELVGGVTCTP